MNKTLKGDIVKYTNSDIVCLTETHLFAKQNINMDNYTFYGHNRQLLHSRAKKASGGVGICVKNNLLLSFQVSVIEKAFEGVLALELIHRMSGLTLVVICVYLPPESSNWGRDCEPFFQHLMSIVYLTIQCDLLIICGDLNARIGSKKDYIEGIDSVPPKSVIDPVVNGHGKVFIEFLQECNLCVLNGRVTPSLNDYTCISTRGKSVVDYFAVPYENLSMCSCFKVETMSDILSKNNLFSKISEGCKASDHSVVTAVFKIMSKNVIADNKESSVNSPIGFKRKRYNFNKNSGDLMNSSLFKGALMQVIENLENQICNQDNVDKAYDSFVKLIFNEIDAYCLLPECTAGTKKRYKFHKPFWTEELTVLWKTMRKSERTWKKCKGSQAQKQHFFNTFKLNRHSFDKRLRQVERCYNRKQILKLEEVNTKNPREFWNKIKRLGPQKNCEIPMKVRIENKLSTDTHDILHKWESDFQALLNRPNKNNFDNEFHKTALSNKLSFENAMQEHDYRENEFINGSIRLDEVHEMVHRLKSKKAIGIDHIPNEVLKNENILNHLHRLLNICFESSVMPSKWKMAIISPIPKGADKDPFLPLNYRGISLNSCLAKVFSSILNKRIVSYCNELNLLVDEQNGFRVGRSCDDHIYSLTSIVRNQIDSNKSVFCAFIDLEKAFDWVDRDLLLYTLLNYNIDGKLYYAIKAMYTKTLSCIKINNFLTNWFEVNTGVKQGDTLSPTLFAIYINDLAMEIKNLSLGININDTIVSILLYADDMILVGNSEIELQTMLSTMYDWCKKWRLNINASKSNIIHFRKKRVKETKFKFTFGPNNISVTNKYKYLGVILDEHLTFQECIQTLSDSAGRALSSIISKFKTYKDAGYNTFTKLLNSGVLPILDYGSNIWGASKTKTANLVLNKAARYILGTHRYSPNAVLYGDTGWLTDKYRRYQSLLRYWNKLIAMSNSRLTKKIFNWEYEQNNKSWCCELKVIFNMIDMGQIYESQQPCDLSVTLKKLESLCESEWQMGLQNKPKLRTYRKIKESYRTEEYLKMCLPRYQRSLLAQFRAGVLPLRLETGRFNIVNDHESGKFRHLRIEERVCQLCNKNSVEDEYHFLMVCPLYTEDRVVLFKKIVNSFSSFKDLDDNEKFNCINKAYQKYLAKYLVCSWEKRKSILFPNNN